MSSTARAPRQRVETSSGAGASASEVSRPLPRGSCRCRATGKEEDRPGGFTEALRVCEVPNAPVRWHLTPMCAAGPGCGLSSGDVAVAEPDMSSVIDDRSAMEILYRSLSLGVQSPEPADSSTRGQASPNPCWGRFEHNSRGRALPRSLGAQPTRSAMNVESPSSTSIGISWAPPKAVKRTSQPASFIASRRYSAPSNERMGSRRP